MPPRKGWQDTWHDDEEDYDDDYGDDGKRYSNNHSQQRKNNINSNNRKQQLCRFYNEGRCKKGAHCDMRHDPTERRGQKSQQLSRQRPPLQQAIGTNYSPFQTRQNTFTTSALAEPPTFRNNPFFTPAQAVAPPTSRLFESTASPAPTRGLGTTNVLRSEAQKQKLVPCEDYLQGGCPNGDRCPFNHDDENLRSIFPDAPVFSPRLRKPEPKTAHRQNFVDLVEDDEDNVFARTPFGAIRNRLPTSATSFQPHVAAQPPVASAMPIPNASHNHATMAARMGGRPLGLATQELWERALPTRTPQINNVYAPLMFGRRLGSGQANNNNNVLGGQFVPVRVDPNRNFMGRHNHRTTGDDVDPDNMSYEQLLELGQAIGNVSKGISQSTFNRLPTRIFTQKKKITNVDLDSDDEENECAICKEEFDDGDHLIVLPCLHTFHGDCIKQWMKDNNTCPLCLRSVNDFK